jgi:sugar lactone lactonase YvrE
LRFPTGIAIEAEGTLVVTDKSTGAVVRVDPVTGDRTVLSGCVAIDAMTFACFASAIGTGPPFHFPTDIAVLPDGALVVTDDASMIIGNTGTVIRVDPATGDRTVFSGCAAPNSDTGECPVLIGAGPPLAFFARGSIAAEAGGAVVIADTASGVVRVDPVTGDRTVLSGCVGRAFPCPAPLGVGPPLGVLTGIAVAPDGALVVVDEGFETGRVVRVHPGTGDRVLVAGFDRGAHAHRGSGPLLLSPSGIAVEVEGALIVVDTMLRAVVRVDPLTGNRTLVSR